MSILFYKKIKIIAFLRKKLYNKHRGDTMDIGTRLYNIRKDLNYTLDDMAEKLSSVSDKEISRSAINRWENGNSNPNASYVALYAKAFGIDLNYLFGISDKCTEIKTERKFSSYVLSPDYASAGLSADSQYYESADKIEVPDEFVGKYKGRKDLEFVKTYGDSMSNIIPEGAVIGYITDNNFFQLSNGDIVLYRYGSDLGVKRYYDIDDSVLFKPDSKNKEYDGKVFIYPKDEYLQIVGKVVIYNVIID